MKILRVYCTTTVLVPLAVVFFGMELFNLRDRSMPWQGDLTWSLDWWGTAFVLTGPVIAAATAVDSGISSRPRRAEMLGGPRAGRRLARGLVTSYVGVLAVVHLLFSVVYLRAVDRWSLADIGEVTLVAAYDVGVIAFYVCLGYCLGRILPVFVSPVAALVVVVGMRALTVGSGLDVLDAGGSTGAMVDVRYRPSWLLLALLACLVLSALLMLAATSGSSTRQLARLPWMLPAAGALGCLLLAVDVLPAAAVPSRLVPTSERLVEDCEEGTPRVCVFDAHVRLLDQVNDEVQQVWVAAGRLGLSGRLPQTYVELSPTAGPTARGVGALSITSSALSTGRLALGDVAYSVVEPVWCPDLYGPEAPTTLLDQTSDLGAALAARSALGDRGPAPSAARKAHLAGELRQVLACR